MPTTYSIVLSNKQELSLAKKRDKVNVDRPVPLTSAELLQRMVDNAMDPLVAADKEKEAAALTKRIDKLNNTERANLEALLDSAGA